MANRKQRVRQRAHELWESEGKPDGRAKEHWQRAEEMLQGERSALGPRRRGTGEESADPATRVAPSEEKEAQAEVTDFYKDIPKT